MFSQNYLRSLHKNAKWRKIICANSKIAQSSLGQQTKLRKKQHFAQKLNPFNCVKTKLYQKKIYIYEFTTFKNIAGYFRFLGYFQLKQFIIYWKKVKIKLRQKDVKI